jgi:hypothetical protein
MAALEPARQQLYSLNVGPTQSEGALFQAAQRRSIRDLGRRGVIKGSTAPAEVAASMAPFESAYQRRREDLSFRLAAAQDAIESDSEMPGYGQAFGATLGDVGSYFALKAGIKDGQESMAPSMSDSLAELKAAGVDMSEQEFLNYMNTASLMIG